jgi:hypothetical protein
MMVGGCIAFGISIIAFIVAVGVYARQPPNLSERNAKAAVERYNRALDGERPRANRSIGMTWTIAPAIGPSGGGVGLALRF